MTELTAVSEQDLRCSVQTAALGEHPAGSAGFARRVLLVELPLPWPKNIEEHELLVDLNLQADKTIKVLGIHSSDATGLDTHRIVCWERTEPFNGYERTETVVDRAAFASAVASTFQDGPLAVADPLDLDESIQDLLICTHGTRDRCCGQLGTRLHSDLDGTLAPNIRIWRTSHTGGHRFAPTGISFPSGTTWSGLTPELTTAIAGQSRNTQELESHYRGNLGIQGRPAQIAEGATFLEQGWGWLDQHRSVDLTTELDVDSPAVVTATVTADNLRRIVTMQEEPAIPVPACGEDIEASTKATPQYRVTSIDP